MEGGNQDKMGNPLHTLDAFYRGQVPWVGMAGDPRIPYGTSATSPQFPGVPFRIVDTGSAFKNAGLSHFDIARDTAEGANADENNRHVQFDIGSPNFALAQGGEATDQAAPPSVAPQPQLQTAAPGVDIGVTPPTPQPTAETQPTPAQPLNLKDPKVLDDLAKRYADAAMGAASQQLVNIPRAELQQNQGIVRKTLGAAYNTAAGFIDGSTSEMGFNMLLNPLAGVVGMAAAVPDLINQVREADKTPPGSPERFQAGANVTGFLAIPAVLHAISKAPTIYKQLTKGGIDASTSSTQRAPGIETPTGIRGAQEVVQGQQTGVQGREGISSPAGSTRQGAKTGGKNRLKQRAVGVNRQNQQGLGGAARADRQSAPDNALAESATGLPPSGGSTVEQPAPSTFQPSADAMELRDRLRNAPLIIEKAPSTFQPSAGAASQIEDGFHVVIPPDPAEPDLGSIEHGPFETRDEAQAFIDSEVGAPEVRIVEIKNGKPVTNPFTGASAGAASPLDAFLAKSETPLSKGKLRSVLGAQVAKRGGGKLYTGTRAAVVEQLVADGYVPTVDQVPVIKDLSRVEWNRLDNRRQAAFEKKQKAAGTKAEYGLEHPAGGGFVVTKAEHDYATHLKQETPAAPVVPETPAPELTKAKAETPAKAVKKVKAAAKATPRDAAEPTPQAATQSGTPNFQATPAQLGVASPLPEFLNAAAQTVTTGQGALKMGRLAQAIKETVRGAMNHTFPKLTNADRLSGELAARWVSSRAAAKYLAKVFSAKVVEGLNVDPAKFGAALTEDNLRSVRAGWQAAGDDVQAAQVKTLIGGPKSPFKTEAEYQAFLNEPAVKTAIERHKALWDQVIEPMYRKAMQLDDSVELPSRGLQTGARVNLFSPKDEPPGAPQRNMVQGVGQGNLTGTMRRKSPFGMRATGGGRTYNTNYHDMMANTYGRQLEVANKNAFENQLVDSGHAVIANVGERPTLPDGEETTAFPLKRTGIVIKDSEGKPRPMQVNRNIYVRKRLAGEYRAAANVDLTQMPWLAKKLTGGLNHAALAGLTDATVHIENLASALFTRPSVAGGALTDTLLSTFGRADVPVTITKAIVKSLKDNNEQLSQLAEIGALRPEFPTRNPGARVIQWADKTTRLVLDDAYKKMVEQGLVEDTETNRREFVNQVGQYNRRAQNSLVRLGRDTGIAPFATAGTTFNALGIRTALMDPGVKATSTPAALALRANVLSKWVGGVTLVASLNYLTTGKVAGRPGVPIGNIDTGKTDENGRPLSIPAFDLLGLGRAMRVTGARGAMTAYRNGLTPGDTVDATGRDIANSQLAPWTGGPTGRVLSSVLNEPFGYGLPKPNPIVPPGDSQIASNLKQAFVHSNPILASAYARAQPGTSTLDALRQQIPRLVPTPSKGADFMAKYPLIVHKAQLNAYTNDLIYRARQLAPAAQQEFLDKAFSRIPKEDWPKTTKELFYRRIPYSPYSRQQAISADQ